MANTDTVDLVVCGAAGRMGRRIIALAYADPRFRVVGATEAGNSPALGQDAGTLAGVEALGVEVTAGVVESKPSALQVRLKIPRVSAPLEYQKTITPVTLFAYLKYEGRTVHIQGLQATMLRDMLVSSCSASIAS